MLAAGKTTASGRAVSQLHFFAEAPRPYCCRYIMETYSVSSQLGCAALAGSDPDSEFSRCTLASLFGGWRS